MKKCPYCQNAISDDIFTCPFCGAKQDIIEPVKTQKSEINLIKIDNRVFSINVYADRISIEIKGKKPLAGLQPGRTDILTKNISSISLINREKALSIQMNNGVYYNLPVFREQAEQIRRAVLGLPPELEEKSKKASPKTSKKTIKIVTFTLLGLFVLCLIFGMINSSTPEGKARNTQYALEYTQTNSAKLLNNYFRETAKIENTPVNTINPTQLNSFTPDFTSTLIVSSTPEFTMTPVISNLQFQDILNKYHQSTEVQWKSYSKEIQGTKVKWTGFVENVDKVLGITSVHVCIDAYYCSDYVFFNYPESMAIKLNKEQKISFTGNIQTISTLFDSVSVSLDNVIILSE